MSNADSDNRRSDKPKVVVRKFSLTEEINEELQTLAKNYYGGNNSQCVRSAIVDHKRTKDGVGERLLRRIEDNVLEVIEIVEEIEEKTDEYDPVDASSKKVKTGTSTESDESKFGNPLTDEMLYVYRQVGNAYPNSLSIDEIASGDLPASDIQRALVDLEDGGYIESHGREEKIEYKMIGSNQI